LADAAGIRLDEIATISDAKASQRFDGGQADLPARSLMQIIPPAKLDYSASIVISWHISPKP
jgi:uncharacterized protein